MIQSPRRSHAFARPARGQTPPRHHSPSHGVPAAQLGNSVVARMVECPDCHQPVRKPCTTLAGAPTNKYHPSRIRLGRRYALAVEAVANDVAL